MSQSICRNCLVLNGCLLPTPQLCKESFHQPVYELFRVPFDYNMLQIYCRVKSRQPPIFKIISPWFTHQWIDFREASPQALASEFVAFPLIFPRFPGKKIFWIIIFPLRWPWTYPIYQGMPGVTPLFSLETKQSAAFRRPGGDNSKNLRGEIEPYSRTQGGCLWWINNPYIYIYVHDQQNKQQC